MSEARKITVHKNAASGSGPGEVYVDHGAPASQEGCRTAYDVAIETCVQQGEGLSTAEAAHLWKRCARAETRVKELEAERGALKEELAVLVARVEDLQTTQGVPEKVWVAIHVTGSLASRSLPIEIFASPNEAARLGFAHDSIRLLEYPIRGAGRSRDKEELAVRDSRNLLPFLKVIEAMMAWAAKLDETGDRTAPDTIRGWVRDLVRAVNKEATDGK